MYTINRKIAYEPLDLVAVGLIIIISMFLFYPVFETYAYTDVYEFLYHAHNDNFIHVFIQGGRPFYGLINKYFFTHTSTVEDLDWLRLFGVAGLVLSVVVFFLLLKKYISNLWVALCGALLFLFSPSASITGLWVGTYQLGWALSVALLGGYLAAEALSSGHVSWRKFIPGVILGLVALLTYQPAYTAFVIPGMLIFLAKPDIRRTVFLLAVYFALYVVYYFIHNLILDFSALQPLSRTGLTDDPVGKLFWFFRWPVKLVFEGNFIFHSEGVRKLVMLAFTGMVVAVMFLLIRAKSVVTALVCIAGTVAFLFASYVPNLISSDNWVSYRTLSTLFMFKIVLVAFAFAWVQRQHRFAIALPAVLCVVLLMNSWYNINKGFVSIQSAEYRLIRSEVDRLLPEMKEKSKLVFVMPEFEFLVKQGVVSRVVSDEFGSLSSSRDWVPMPIVKQILREKGEVELEQKLKVINVFSTDSVKISEHHGLPMLDVEWLFLSAKPLQ